MLLSPVDRRRFLRQSGAGCLLSLGQLFAPDASALDGGPAGQLPFQGAMPDDDIDRETLEFWTKAVRSPAREAARSPAPGISTGVRSARSRPGGPEPAVAPLLSSRLANEPVFFFYVQDKGFQRAHLLEPSALPARGDIDVSMQILECRPSAHAYERFAKFETGSMRIDVQQGQPVATLGETLAWTALGAVLPDSKGKVPRLSESFDLAKGWGRGQRVPLPGGFGSWTWNFFLKEKESPWTQFINFARLAMGQVAASPMLTLPSIGKSALKQVDMLLGRIQAIKGSRWEFQSRDVEIYGTRESLDHVGPRAVQLRTGDYLLVPTSQADQFEERMPALKLADGRLVPADVRTSALNRAAEQTLPELSYLTLHVGARPRESCKCPPV